MSDESDDPEVGLTDDEYAREIVFGMAFLCWFTVGLATMAFAGLLTYPLRKVSSTAAESYEQAMDLFGELVWSAGLIWLSEKMRGNSNKDANEALE